MDDETARDRLESVGKSYSTDLMLLTRAATRRAADEIASRMSPGMPEEVARKVAAEVLHDAGLRKGWHKILVRFGKNTTKNFEDPSEPGVVLGDSDIFFVDIGPIRDSCEGDAGTTVALGNDTAMNAAASDVRDLWKLVRNKWLKQGLTGVGLYEFAAAQAKEMGWLLNLDLTGHRLSDFPHDAYYDGTLSDVGFRPVSGLWVLEIQIRHPVREFGAFFEDLLIEDDDLQEQAFS